MEFVGYEMIVLKGGELDFLSLGVRERLSIPVSSGENWGKFMLLKKCSLLLKKLTVRMRN